MSTQIANLITSAHINTNGYWSAANGASTSIHSSATSTEYVYQLVNPNWNYITTDFSWKYINDTTSPDYQKWMDVGGGNPIFISEGSTFNSTTSTTANPQIVSFWQGNGSLLFSINNPYYNIPGTSGSGGGTGTGGSSTQKKVFCNFW